LVSGSPSTGDGTVNCPAVSAAATVMGPLAVVAALLAEERRALAGAPAPAADQSARPSGWLVAARREALEP